MRVPVLPREDGSSPAKRVWPTNREESLMRMYARTPTPHERAGERPARLGAGGRQGFKPWASLHARGDAVARKNTSRTGRRTSDNGEYVVVVNAERVILTGRKLSEKKYYRHSGYPGHLKEVTAARMPGDASRARDTTCRAGHAAQKQAGALPAAKTEGICGRESSASGANPRSDSARLKLREALNANMATIPKHYATGKRKTSVARVWIEPGDGRILVNNTPANEVFPPRTPRSW